RRQRGDLESHLIATEAGNAARVAGSGTAEGAGSLQLLKHGGREQARTATVRAGSQSRPASQGSERPATRALTGRRMRHVRVIAAEQSECPAVAVAGEHHHPGNAAMLDEEYARGIQQTATIECG